MSHPQNGPPPVLYAEDIARIRKIGIHAARRLLVSLEEKYGAAVVGSDATHGRTSARRRWTTTAALSRVLPVLDGASEIDVVSDLAEKYAQLEERVRILEYARA